MRFGKQLVVALTLVSIAGFPQLSITEAAANPRFIWPRDIIEMLRSPGGRYVAVYDATGICAIDQLWYTSTSHPKSRKTAEWHECLQGSGTAVVNRHLVGWAKDGRTVVLEAEVWTGEDMPAANSVRSTRKVKAYFDVTKPASAHKGKLVSHLH